MIFKSRVWLSAFLFTFCFALSPSGRVLAQQTTGAPASSNTIDQLTGPIALYPDALLFQILPASTNVETVKSFSGWLGKNANLKGSDLQAAAQKAGFDAPYVALAPFPQVIQMMAEKPDWTKALGQAFAADGKAIFDSIQRLRAQAKAAGNLKTTSQQVVNTQTTSDGQQVIVIQPANPQVIYVPVYSTQVVYVAAPPPPPSGGSVAGAAVVGFTVGVIVGSNNSYYRASNEYWEDREDYYQDRKSDAQANQDQRQSEKQANQDQRQSEKQANQDQRQSDAQTKQSERQSGASSAQSQAATSSRGGGQTASQPGGTGSGGGSSYQSGSATRSQSSRGSSSRSASKDGGGGGGGKDGGGGGSRGGGGRGR
jgi:hypothetical protein